MVGLSSWCGFVDYDWFFSVTVVQIAKALTKKGRKYDVVFDMGAKKHHQSTPAFWKGCQSSYDFPRGNTTLVVFPSKRGSLH
jgi:hypothetical protein